MEISNRLFFYSLTISLLTHSALLFYVSSARLFNVKKPLNNMQITYAPIKKKSAPAATKELNDYKMMDKIEATKKVKVIDKDFGEKSVIGADIKDITNLKGGFKTAEKQTPKINTVDMKRLIAIPVLQSEKITNPRYLSHKQDMRSKIYQRAFSYAKQIGYDEGDVYVSFVVDRVGNLKGLKVIGEKTHAPENLQQISIRSIKEAAPFSPFPKELDFDELPFSIVISYMLQEK